jgi:thiol-disulfide isomerase/thioredoxin/uncharacterized membrane protein YphA (DoxX/SURF4 family)
MLDLVVLTSRLILAILFLVAGLAKLADRRGSQIAITDFGLPAWLATPLGIGVPLAELATAALLLSATAWWGAVSALTLLLSFSAAIIVNLLRGRTPDCHCFGELRAKPISRSTLARNGVLAAMSAFLITLGPSDPRTDVVRLVGTLTNSQLLVGAAAIAMSGLMALQGYILFNLLRQSGRLQVRLEALESTLDGASTPHRVPSVHEANGLPLGAPAPNFHLPSLNGRALTLNEFMGIGKPILLVFTDPGCGPCDALFPLVGRWQRDHIERLTIALISRGTIEHNQAKSVEYGLNPIMLQSDREVAQAYRAHGTPSAVLVRPDGRIGSPVAAGVEAVRTLVARTVRNPAPELLPLVAHGHMDHRSTLAIPAPGRPKEHTATRLPK